MGDRLSVNADKPSFTLEQPTTGSIVKRTIEEPSKWASAWEQTKAFTSGFCEYYADKYRGTESIGDALRKTAEIHNEGFEIMDRANPLNFIKDPIKEWAHRVDERVDNGDDSKETAGERAWALAKSSGKILDNLTTSKGLTYTTLAVTLGPAALKAAGEGITTAAGALQGAGYSKTAMVLGTLPALIADGLMINGGYKVTKGSARMLIGGTKQQIQNGANNIVKGGLIFTAGYALAKPAVRIAHDSGVWTNPDLANSGIKAAAESFRIPRTVYDEVVHGEVPDAFTGTQPITAGSPEFLRYGHEFTNNATGQEEIFARPNWSQCVQTAKGEQWTMEGEVIAVDSNGMPYITTARNILKNSTGLSQEAINELYTADPSMAADGSNFSLWQNNYWAQRAFLKAQGISDVSSLVKVNSFGTFFKLKYNTPAGAQEFVGNHAVVSDDIANGIDMESSLIRQFLRRHPKVSQ